MGLFSTKKKTVVGVQTFDLGTDGYASYYHFRHNALFAAQGNSRAYLKAMNSYKHSVKSSYSSKRLQRYQIPFVSSPFSYTINPKVTEAIKVVTEAKDEAVYGIQDFATLGTNRDRFNVVVNASGVTKDSKISSSSVFTIEDQAIFLAVTIEDRAEQLAGTNNIFPINNISTIYYDGEDSNNRHIFRIGYRSHIYADQRWIGIEFRIKEIIGYRSKTVDYGDFWDGYAYIHINDSYAIFRQERYFYNNNNGPDTYIWLGSDGTELTADDDDPHYFGIFPVADNVYLDRYSDQSIEDARDAVLDETTNVYVNDSDYTNHYTMIAPYYYPSVHYATGAFNYVEEVYSPHYYQDGYIYFDGDIQDLLSYNTTTNGSYLAEPLFNVKSRTKSISEIEQDESNMTEEEKRQYRRERFFQKKIFDSFSINLDSFATQFADDKIKEMSIGIMFDFSKIEQSQAALASLYRSMEIILPNDFLLVNQKAMDNGYYPCSVSNRISLNIPFGEGNIITRFVLQRQTYDTTESVPSSSLYSLRVKAKATITNDVKNRDFCVELYEAHYGENSADGKTPLEMRSEVIHDYMQYSNPEEDAPQTLQDAFSQFPTKRSCMPKYDIKYFRCQVKSEPADINEAMTMLNDHDIDIENYAGVLFRCREIPNGDPNSYYKLSKIFTKLVGTRESNTIGEGLNTVYKLKKFDLQNNTTTEYILSDLYSYFSDGQHSYIKKYTEDSNSGSDFFLPARAGALNSLKFYDYIEAKDVLLSGIVFTVQVIKIKWYQQAWFSWLLIIVTVVISVVVTVSTGGTGATVGSALLSSIENFAVGIAVSKAIEYLAPKLGLDVADIGLIIAVVSIYYGEGSDAMKLLNLGDKYLKKELQEEIDKLKSIKKDMLTFKKEAEEALKRLSDSNKTSLTYAYWAIAENINNKTKSGKQYSLEELEYMVEVDKYSVPFQNIYTEDLEAELYKIVNDDL